MLVVVDNCSHGMDPGMRSCWNARDYPKRFLRFLTGDQNIYFLQYTNRVRVKRVFHIASRMLQRDAFVVVSIQHSSSACDWPMPWCCSVDCRHTQNIVVASDRTIPVCAFPDQCSILLFKLSFHPIFQQLASQPGPSRVCTCLLAKSKNLFLP